MKRVSFSVAKALKAAGYPYSQNGKHYSIGVKIQKFSWDVISGDWNELEPITKEGVLFGDDGLIYETNSEMCIYAPTYIEVWLWLWREKKIYIGLEAESYPHDGMCVPSYIDAPYSDPEEAIESAINHLVEQNLIK